MNAIVENKAPETGTIKAPFDAIHISKEDGIMIATFAHQNCRILRIECGACDFNAGNVLGLNGLEGKIEIAGIKNMNTWPPVKNVYDSQFTDEQIRAATDKDGFVDVNALNEIRFSSADELIANQLTQKK